MLAALDTIPLSHLALAAIPGVIVLIVLFRWSANAFSAGFALGRMLLQLLLVGYVLTFVFQSEHLGITLAVLTIMLAAASWIALRPLQEKRRRLYVKALASISIGGGLTLLLIVAAVLRSDPWYLPSTLIPLAGMIFASSMNSVSLAAERFDAETKKDTNYPEARRTALTASMIPTINSLLAVGIVSIPGMMTGQILSGVSPLVAARYQIMVMMMIFGASGISTACYLTLMKPSNPVGSP